MKKSDKFIQQIKSYYKSLAINSYRFWLTIIGMTIGVVILFVGIIFLDSYTSGFYSGYKEFKDEIIYVCNENGIDEESVHYFHNNLENDTLTYYSPYFIKNEVESNIVLPYLMRGVSPNFVNNYLPENYAEITTIGHPAVNRRKWFRGKTWTSEEIESKQRRVVINYFGARCLFGDENPIDKYIQVNGRRYKVVGVIADSDSTDRQIVETNKQLGRAKDDEPVTYPYIEVYMPMTTFARDFNMQNKPTNLIIKLSDEKLKQSTVTNLQHYYRSEIEKGNVNISYRERIETDIEKSIAEFMPTLIAILVFVLVISGMMTMNTLFFNIKEKIPEIGIRKAMGASRSNILTQIVFEGVLYALLAFVLGALISAIGFIVAKLIFYFKSIITVDVTVDLLHAAIVSIVFVVESALVSLIPALYGSRMKVVDAVKFE